MSMYVCVSVCMCVCVAFNELGAKSPPSTLALPSVSRGIVPCLCFGKQLGLCDGV